jgi:hypothetical protein
MKNCVGTLDGLLASLKLINNTSKDVSIVKWSQMAHHLLHEIPLFRFLLKIASAYPNADRNLNLEAFENRILNQ